MRRGSLAALGWRCAACSSVTRHPDNRDRRARARSLVDRRSASSTCIALLNVDLYRQTSPKARRVVRNQGKFNAELPLGRYPFDAQDLVVAIEESDSTTATSCSCPHRRPISLSEDLTLPWR